MTEQLGGCLAAGQGKHTTESLHSVPVKKYCEVFLRLG